MPAPIPIVYLGGAKRHLYREVTTAPDRFFGGELYQSVTIRPGGDGSRKVIRLSYPQRIPEYANRAERCGVDHPEPRYRAWSCGDTARIVTVSAV
ncbi:hypothetical protein GCM10022206_57590 [Streptomyces chiangmaiensis]